ncbi:MAG: L-seryl-tRNA(Sec) selenium transferase [Firmicutes bacterium]|nr:L-seryl-tRNA(Sec) selenium transferase [Alicyclobacillaceae bacterium]MCL6497601.1 L-seryl-tRNA(Sec) selenium transferase [Bacillota bacterium]
MRAVQAQLRQLPSVKALLEAVGAEKDAVAGVWWHEAATAVLDRARDHIRQGKGAPDLRALVAAVRAEARQRAEPHLRPVINATGVAIHTNLGRAPLPDAVLAQVSAVARGYSTLEYDLGQGRRGSRHSHVDALLRHLTGAEAAMVVNNNAAAVLLALSTLARGREALVSRGQLVEIGGSFRIPDVMALSGAILREVGTTNKTHLADYERAITPETALVVKVHTSNFRLLGFTAQPSTRALAELAHRHGLALMEDLGSGSLLPFRLGDWEEPTVREVVADGVDVVTFSGDKLLGGPQAGLVVGRRDIIEQMKRNPLARAVRVDKMTLAALEAVLRWYHEGRGEALPLWQMLRASPESIRRRALGLGRRVRRAVGPDVALEVVPDTSEVGGGSMPGTTLPTWVLAIRPSPPLTVEAVEARLRSGRPPVVARIAKDSLRVDLRTVLPDEERPLAEALALALRPGREAEHVDPIL